MVRSSGVRIARHHTACRTVDTKPRRGILADDPVSDRSGRRRCLQPLQKGGGNAVFFGCGEAVHPDGAVGYRRVPALSALFHTLSQPLPVPKNGTFSLSRAQSRTCSGYAEARKRRMKFNVFVKPNEQSRACASYAEARKRRMKFNVFVKPNEQSRACASYAEAGKRQLKTNEPFR